MKLFVFKKENGRLHDVIEAEAEESCEQYAKEHYDNSKYYWKDTWDYVITPSSGAGED